MQFITATTNAENVRQYKIGFSLVVEQILAFTSSNNVVRGVKGLVPNFKKLRDNVFRH